MRSERRARAMAGRALRSSPQPVQRLIQRVRGGPATTSVAEEPVAADTEVWRSPPVPLPDGVTLEQLTAVFRTWSVNGEPPGHLDAYVDDSLWRFCHTWALVREESGRCLELGANPYFTTHLLHEYTDLELTLANYYGQSGETAETVSYVPTNATARVERTHRSVLFSVGEEPFPLETASFSVVLFCAGTSSIDVSLDGASIGHLVLPGASPARFKRFEWTIAATAPSETLCLRGKPTKVFTYPLIDAVAIKPFSSAASPIAIAGASAASAASAAAGGPIGPN